MPKLLLEQVLKKRKLSKYRFAKLLRQHYNNVARYFRPGYDPKLSTLATWAKVLHCRIRDLYKE